MGVEDKKEGGEDEVDLQSPVDGPPAPRSSAAAISGWRQLLFRDLCEDRWIEHDKFLMAFHRAVRSPAIETGGGSMDQFCDLAESTGDRTLMDWSKNVPEAVDEDWGDLSSEAKIMAGKNSTESDLANRCLGSDPVTDNRKRSGENFDFVDDLMSRLDPCFRKHVAEVFDMALFPLVSALRTREEDEQKHREKLLALEAAKLALEREKMLLKRRRIAHPRPSP